MCVIPGVMKTFVLTTLVITLSACALLPEKKVEVSVIALTGTPLTASVPKHCVSNPNIVSASPSLIFEIPQSSKKSAGRQPPKLKIAQISDELKQDALPRYADEQAVKSVSVRLASHELLIDGRPAIEWAFDKSVRYDRAEGGSGTENIV